MVKEIVIVGGGYSGVDAAMTLAKKKDGDLHITVIDKEIYHTLRTVLHEVAGNRLKPNSVTIPFKAIFKDTKVNYIQDEIKDYDFENQSLKGKNMTYHYDYLILAMGSEPNFLGLEGAKENTYHLWNYNDAIRVRRQIRECFVKAQTCQDAKERAKMLTFAVVGSGATGIEMMGEIHRWVQELSKSYHIPISEVRLVLADRSKRVLKVLDERNSKKANDFLVNKLGIELMLGVTVGNIVKGGFNAGDLFIPCDTLIWAAGVRASEQVEALDVEKLQGRRLAVNEFGQTVHPNVYVVGDLSGLRDKEGNLYPAMAENAFSTGTGVAENIVRVIKGQPLKPIEVKMHGSIVCIGSRFAVAELGKVIFPAWVATIMKGIVTIHYVWTLTGLGGVWKYAVREFYDTKAEPERKMVNPPM